MDNRHDMVLSVVPLHFNKKEIKKVEKEETQPSDMTTIKLELIRADVWCPGQTIIQLGDIF